MSLRLCRQVDIMDLVSTFSMENSQNLDSYFENFDIYQKQSQRCSSCPGCEALYEYDIFDIVFKQELQIIKEFFNYCFSKGLLTKTDYQLQKRLANIVCNINNWTGICSEKDAQVFFHSVFHLLTIETLLYYTKVEESYSETIFHQLFNSDYDLSNNYMKVMFLLFDKIKFNYRTPRMRSLLTAATYAYDTYSIKELINRGLTINQIEMTECLTHLIKRDLCYLKYQYDNDEYDKDKRFLLNYIYNDPTLIVEIFKDVNSDKNDYDGPIEYDETGREIGYLDLNIIAKLMPIMQGKYNKYDDEEDIFYDILSLHNRRKLVRPLKALESIYELFSVVKEYGYNMRKVADRYFLGCLPIKLLNPEMHQKFHELFT